MASTTLFDMNASTTAMPEEEHSLALRLGIGLVCVLLIACCAFLGIILLSMVGKRAYNIVIMLLVGLGVGTLLGAAAFHLIPEVFSAHDVLLSHGYLQNSAWIIFGLFLFFAFDKLLRYYAFYKERNQKVLEFDSTNSLENVSVASTVNSKNPVLTIPTPEDRVLRRTDTEESMIDLRRPTSKSITAQPVFEEGQNKIKAVAWMLLFGDGMNNFVDGLTIGVAFAGSVTDGIAIFIPIFIQEFSHEMGDVAMLMNAGMTLKQAAIYNVLVAVTGVMGYATGAAIGTQLEGATEAINAMAVGMFFYIALACLIPEMNDVVEKKMKKNFAMGSLILFLQIVGIGLGILFALLGSMYADSLNPF